MVKKIRAFKGTPYGGLFFGQTGVFFSGQTGDLDHYMPRSIPSGTVELFVGLEVVFVCRWASAFGLCFF